MLARETLDLLDAADWESLKEGVKIDRKAVRRCVLEALTF
jgi:hypothetical protein